MAMSAGGIRVKPGLYFDLHAIHLVDDRRILKVSPEPPPERGRRIFSGTMPFCDAAINDRLKGYAFPRSRATKGQPKRGCNNKHGR